MFFIFRKLTKCFFTRTSCPPTGAIPGQQDCNNPTQRDCFAMLSGWIDAKYRGKLPFSFSWAQLAHATAAQALVCIDHHGHTVALPFYQTVGQIDDVFKAKVLQNNH